MSEPEVIPLRGNADVDPKAKPSFMQRWRWPMIIGGPLLIIAVVVYFIVTGGKTQTTDDAYVQIAKAPVAPSIAGRVTDIYVRENDVVKRGQVLFRLDVRDMQANAEAAAAQVANASLQVGALRASYQQEQAMVQAAKDQLAYATTEAVRAKNLANVGVDSQAQVDQANHAVLAARQQLAAAQQQAAQVLANLNGNPNLAPGAAPAVMQAQAQFDRAKLNVAYGTVAAPADGVVTRVDQMPVGTYLNASQTGFWLLSGEPWIEANFKEDQLAHMKVGQPVTIKIDAYPEGLKGHVASFSPGTGQAFSALPAQNATGNWVKVVQRLPVRIAFDKTPPDMAGRAGLSAKVTVDVRAPGAR
ncbi:HlyD family secretion protein [Phenylobacterium sp.]|uniref:HlyD family secretion protein n=1 Tax=Phenylobacterium sp. TaxID=1871053 RepID=UPI002E30B95E|nr:HlyD family secretion protein [Phenylobacterium sp.]HEX3367647.1 HlyD family secretion protein [Phenylobacterium sp.]